MRDLQRLCTRLNREVNGTYCVTKTFCVDCSGHRFHLYSVYYRENGPFELERAFYTIADTRRFLLDQFLY